MTELRFRQVHLDFHTSEKIGGIGSRFDAEKFARMLQQAHVNSVTCFSRCHHGWIYHDTRFPNRHPHLQVNLLKEQIDACHKLGIRVPIYITVGWDEYSYHHHPEWAERTPEGTLAGAGPLQAGWRKMCFNPRSGYMKYVEAQTREVCELFEVDGVFFDIIWQGQCCCETCLQGMLGEGLRPELAADRVEYAASIVAWYKRHFTQLVKSAHPQATVFHNSGHIYPDWRPLLDTYTHLEIESLPSGGWGYAHFPVTVRYARGLGLDCLGMTGKFHTSWGDFSSFKHQEALEYEVFTQIANAAKCSIGDQLHPTGEICPETYRLIGSVYGRVEALEPWLAGARPVTEIAVFNPEAIGKQDAQVDSSARGAYRMLTESHHQFDYVDCESDLSAYRVLLLPDKITLDCALARKVKAFLEAGGAVLASCRSGLDPEEKQFALAEFGLEYVGEAPYSPDFVQAREAIAEGTPSVPSVMYECGMEVRPAAGAEVLAATYDPYFDRSYEHFCSHQHTPLDRQAERPAATRAVKVVYLAHPVFGMYQRKGARFWRRLAMNSLALLLPSPLVRTNAPTTAQITVTRQEPEGRTMVHVLHYIPERRADQIDTVQDVIPLHEVEIALRCERVPSRATLAPSGAELPCEWADGYARVRLPRVEGYAVAVFDD